MSENIERRVYPTEIEVRRVGGKPPKLVGYAAVFDSLSDDLGGFREKIAPGTFKKTIRRSDVRALWNHDPNYVLGRRKAKTLKLKEDEHGLRSEWHDAMYKIKEFNQNPFLSSFFINRFFFNLSFLR